jgi:3-oxoacyl-[acyl-carrier protein] reductase
MCDGQNGEQQMINLEGKVALVTGGTRGIGAACSRMFAQAGARVAMSYLNNTAAAEKVLAEIRALGGTAIAIAGDLAREEDADRLVAETITSFGRLDILVNNHGIWPYGAIDTMPTDVWLRAMDVNLNAVMYVTRAAARQMKLQKSGTIINISSTAGQRGEAFHSHYAATKGAVISLTKSWSTELAPDGITVNCVAPGWVDTEMCDEVFADAAYKEQVRKGIPIGRIPPPEDIAGPVIFLASHLARHITGEILNVNGGSVLCG